MKNSSWLQALGNALRGIGRTAARERNFRIQIFFALAAVVFCVIARVPALHFILVAAAIFFVLVAELINTAIEALTDLACGGEMHPLAKVAKDAAAGAVLLASVFSLVVGAFVLIETVRRFI